LEEGSDIMKMCIFNENKNCDSCGECDLCEYNRDKKCDNCSKCLQIEGYDVKAIKIDEVFDKVSNDQKINLDIEDFSEFDVDEEDALCEELVEEISNEEYIDALDDENNWEYIDDIDDIKELLDDVDNLNELGFEKYPGLIVINNNRK
jgi:hypothetical protein